MADRPDASRRPKAPCALVVFGGTGDLARRKLIPGLYSLCKDGLLPAGFAVVGIGRGAPDLESFRALHQESTSRFARARPLEDAAWGAFASRIEYVRGDLTDPEMYGRLRAQLDEADRTHGTAGNRLYFLAIPPSDFPGVLGQLRAAGLLYPLGDERFSRVMIEKPFGRDLQSARELNAMCAEFLDESQTYRIDHYLGKETVQNILVLRFGNAIFEPLWNRKYIDYVEITAAEELGVEGRGKFYDETGVLRDVVQNHLLEVLALTAMEPPVSFRADDLRDERVQVLRSLRPITGASVDAEVVRGQYRGYRAEPFVSPTSTTPTYVALRVMIDNWRWHGVPFYLRAGKRLAARQTEIAIHFQRVPLVLFGREGQTLDGNVLVLKIQPDEGIRLRFVCKSPGDELHVSNVTMDMSYAGSFDTPAQEAYERLFLDCLRGDSALFARRDDVEHAWRFVDPILARWAEQAGAAHAGGAIETYEPGTDGPACGAALLAHDGRRWRDVR